MIKYPLYIVTIVLCIIILISVYQSRPFKINEKQYLAVIATGGRYHNYSKKYGELYVFSLN